MNTATKQGYIGVLLGGIMAALGLLQVLPANATERDIIIGCTVTTLGFVTVWSLIIIASITAAKQEILDRITTTQPTKEPS